MFCEILLATFVSWACFSFFATEEKEGHREKKEKRQKLVLWEFKCNLLLDKESRKILLKIAHKKQEIERLYYEEHEEKKLNYKGDWCFV